MTNNIEVQMRQSFSCIDSAMNTIMKWKNIDMEYIYINLWGFSFKHTAKSINKCIKSNKGSITLPLYCYSGVKIKTKHIRKKNILKYLNKRLAKNEPIILLTDVYNCNWKKQYKKKHDGHLVIILSVDKNGNCKCLDCSYYGSIYGETTISYNDLIEGYNKFYELIQVKETRDINPYFQIFKSVLCFKNRINNNVISLFELLRVPDKLILSILLAINKINKRSSFKDIKTFASKLEYYCKSNKSFKTNLSNFIKILTEISSSRYKYSIALDYYNHKINNEKLSIISNEFKKLSSNWHEIKNLFCEYVLNSDTNHIQKIVDKLNNIAYIEEDLSDKLYELMDKKENMFI